jgi:hypothetical protein
LAKAATNNESRQNGGLRLRRGNDSGLQAYNIKSATKVVIRIEYFITRPINDAKRRVAGLCFKGIISDVNELHDWFIVIYCIPT